MTKYLNEMNGDFICLMLCVYHKYSNKLNNNYINLLYNKCCNLFKDNKTYQTINIILLSKICIELNKLKYFNKFIKFIADEKIENVNKIFDKEIIKKSGINILHSIINNKYSNHKNNIDYILSDPQFIAIKKAFVSITVQIAKQYTQQTQESTILLAICAKSMIKFDEKSKNLKRTTIFDKREFQKLVWCFGFAKYRNDNFWKDLYGKIKKLNTTEINSDIITKFSWSIARVASYLSKRKQDNLIHGPMNWCIKNSCELISKQSTTELTNIFSLEELSTICWSISICGKPSSINNDIRSLKYYIKLFDCIVSNIWEIVDFNLLGKPQYYMNILSAMLTYKDELLMDIESNGGNNQNKMNMLMDINIQQDEDSDNDNVNINHKNHNKHESIKDKVIEFIIHVLNQFNISERGQKYMKDDPNIIDFLLHIAAEFRRHVVELEIHKNNSHDSEYNNINIDTIIPEQMIKQINKMLEYLMELHVDITHECAFSICCTMSRIPYNIQLINTKYKVLNFLCNLIIKESYKYQINKEKRKNKNNNNNNSSFLSEKTNINNEKERYLMLDYTLGLCSAICAHSTEPNNNISLQWDQNVINTLLKSAKYYLYEQKDKWSDNHFLLKNHLKFFIDKFDKK